MAKRQPKTAKTKHNWWVVKPGKGLFWPGNIDRSGGGDVHVWARGGVAVDLADPYLEALASGQMHRLKKPDWDTPPNGQKVATYIHPYHQREMERFRAKREGTKAPAKEAQVAAATGSSPDDLPGLEGA